MSVADAEWLHLLVGDWQLLSDLSFADLVLWLPEDDGSAWVAGAHVRPATGPMVFFEDQVGNRVERGRRTQIDTAYDESRILRERDPDWNADDVPVREEAIPVVREGHPIAVLTRHTNLAAARMPSRLELSYLSAADDLSRMIAAGDVSRRRRADRLAPRRSARGRRLRAPGRRGGRRLRESERRLGGPPDRASGGEVVGASLAEVVTPLLHRRRRRRREPGRSWSGAGRRGGPTSRPTGPACRCAPSRSCTTAARSAAIVLLRDVSELRRRERELMTKDATIREIHHRVKNNLQTVAALLRLQARRVPPDAEGRGALEEAIRRVGAIAVVHDTLSQGLDETVDFDDVVAQTADA